MGDSVKSYLMRPVIANPPLTTMSDLKTVLTIDDLADLHEALNIRELQMEPE